MRERDRFQHEWETLQLSEISYETRSLGEGTPESDVFSAAGLLLIERGEIDTAHLTNREFAVRCQTRGITPPKKLARTDPLANAWRTLQNKVIRPALTRLPAFPDVNTRTHTVTLAGPSGCSATRRLLVPPSGYVSPLRPAPECSGGRRFIASSGVLESVPPAYRVGARNESLHWAALDAYRALKGAADAATELRSVHNRSGVLKVASGFRSVELQRQIWNSKAAKYPSETERAKWVARPGCSLHHTGCAIDFSMGAAGNASENVEVQRLTLLYRWLICHAPRFGFYPYEAEPWHWEYNPPGFNPSQQRPGGLTAAPAPHVQPPQATAPPRSTLPPAVVDASVGPALMTLGYDLDAESDAATVHRRLTEFAKDRALTMRPGTVPRSVVDALRKTAQQFLVLKQRHPSARHLSRFRVTTYYVADEATFNEPATIPVLDKDGHELARVGARFFLSMSLEGTGRTRAGEIFNVSHDKVDVSGIAEYAQLYPTAVAFYGGKADNIGKSGLTARNGRVVGALGFHRVSGYPKLRGIQLTPFRTLAADIGTAKYRCVDKRFKGKDGLVPPKTWVFLAELAGLRLPDGTTHDGWCQVNDTGGAIFGAHFDLFVGDRANSSWLRTQARIPEICHAWFSDSEARVPPSYTYGLHKEDCKQRPGG